MFVHHQQIPASVDGPSLGKLSFVFETREQKNASSAAVTTTHYRAIPEAGATMQQHRDAFAHGRSKRKRSWPG